MRFPARSALTFLLALAVLSCGETPVSPLQPGDPRFTTGVTPPEVVISQVYGGGGNSGATYKNDFVELFNPGTAAVDVTGWSVQYASAAGSTWQVASLSGTIEPGAYYLIQQAAGAGGSVDLPEPDAAGGANMAAGAGKVWLMRNTTALSGTCPAGPAVVDQVSYGSTASNCGFGTTPAPGNSLAAVRKDDGCAYSENLAADFQTALPNPRNSSSPTHTCSGPPPPPPPPPAAADVLISQIYGGGGNSGALYTHDYIELFNRGDEPVGLDGWMVLYASAAGTSWQATPLTGTIEPGRYYLVQQAAGAGGTLALPTPDATGSIAMAAGAGKVLLVQPGTSVSGACPAAAGIMDRVGYGSNTTDNGCAEQWGGRTGNLSNTTAAFRKNDGCVNTGNAADDFVVQLTNPRNSASPARDCAGSTERPQSSETIVINELMGDPAFAESASWGQWFEVHNYGTTAVDLSGWTIISDGTSQPDHTIASSVVVPPGGFAVLGRGADLNRNGGVTLNYNYFTGNATTIWLDPVDYLMLVDAEGARVDSVAWTGLPRGVTKALRDRSLPRADVDGPNWGYSTTTYGDGDYGTPGAANGTLADEPPFVSPNTITIVGRTSGDAPLPVGFESQLFATERDQNNVVVPTTFTWASLTPTIASVDERGVIRALAAGQAQFEVTSAIGTTRLHTLTMETPVASTTAQYGNHTEFGDPSPHHPTLSYIVRRPQFTTSWNGTRGIPNWVAYNLNATHIVSGQDRCNCFTFDPVLEAAGFQRYNTADYTGAGAHAGFGIDRGHLVRSFDRTTATLDNAVTYYFSNVLPQTADLNQGPWAVMENHLGDLARFQDREVYIYAGAVGNSGTVKDEGRITIPAHNWKVAVIMPRGKGLADVEDYRDLDVLAAVMPNIPGIRFVDWQTYTVLPDSVDRLTGYQLLSALPGNIQRALKTGTMPPIARADGPYTATEGSPVSMSGAASVDPNGFITSHLWRFGDGASGSGAAVSHTYARYGNYTVRLIVTDNDGLVDTLTTMAQVANVPPVIGAFAGATLLPGETYSAAGSFTDPGAGPWSGTVDYGDGSGIKPLPLAGKGFALSHRYTAAGNFTVTVRVSDGAATATATQTVTVLAPVAAVRNAIVQIDQLVAAGKLSAGNGTSLRAKLEAAASQLENERPAAAGQLGAFRSELEALATGGRISRADAGPLLTLIDRVISALRSSA